MLEREYHGLAPTTILRHAVMPRHLTLPQFLGDVMEKLARDGRNATQLAYLSPV